MCYEKINDDDNDEFVNTEVNVIHNTVTKVTKQKRNRHCMLSVGLHYWVAKTHAALPH